MLCQQFSCLPSQLDAEDGVRLLNMVYAQSVSQAFQRMRENKQTSDDMELIGPILTEQARRTK